MKRILIFLISSMIFAGTVGFAQKQAASPFGSSAFFPTSVGNASLLKQDPERKASALLRPIPSDFYSSRMGFFCRNERLLDRYTVLPIRFRLGSLEACKRQEGYLNYR